MNTKQIAESVGRDERSVRRWIKKASDKMSGLADKMSEAENLKKPADYTLEETIAIIEAGMGKNAAGIFRANAEEKPAVDRALTIRDIPEIVQETVKALMPMFQQMLQQVAQMPSMPSTVQIALPEPEYYTAKGYALKLGLRLDNKTLQSVGREASRMSRMNSVQIRQMPDAEYGNIGLYRNDILKSVIEGLSVLSDRREEVAHENNRA